MVQFYTFKATFKARFTYLIELKSGKQFKSTCCSLHNTVVKIVTHFPLSSNKTALRHYSLRRLFAWDSMGVCWGGGGGGGWLCNFHGLGIFSKIS